MIGEQNKSVARRYCESVLNRGDVNALDDLAVADYVEFDPLPGQGTGLAGRRFEARWDRSHMYFISSRPCFGTRSGHSHNLVGPVASFSTSGQGNRN